MTKNTAILSVIVVGLVSVSAFVFYSFMRIGPDVSPSNSQIVQKKTVLPQATGDIDDVVNSFIQAIDDEQLPTGSGAEEKTLITSDSQEVSGFSQSADENEF